MYCHDILIVSMSSMLARFQAQLAHQASIRISNPAPLDYVTPEFPSLYWPFEVKPGAANYLYFTYDIWRFTLFWTLIIYAGLHAATLTFALLVRIKFGNTKSTFQWKIAFLVSAGYALVAGLEALLAGTGIGFWYVGHVR